jgi:micrococcal nuclease
MLDDIDAAFFKTRIDEILHGETATDWQRQFLTDVRRKLERYGTRTKLSDKQLAILRRLTNANLRKPPAIAVVENRTLSYRPPTPPAEMPAVRRPFRQSRARKSRPMGLFRAPYGMRSAYFAGRDVIAMLGAIILCIGFGASMFGLSSTVERSQLANLDNATSGQPSAAQMKFTITDGDTIRLSNGTRVRLVGYNTPEKFEPMCQAEAELGHRASDRLKELVDRASATQVNLVACSCKPGTEGTKRCNYGRSCGRLEVDGREVGQILIREGLAVPFVCGATGCPPTPRPWCG